MLLKMHVVHSELMDFQDRQSFWNSKKLPIYFNKFYYPSLEITSTLSVSTIFSDTLENNTVTWISKRNIRLWQKQIFENKLCLPYTPEKGWVTVLAAYNHIRLYQILWIRNQEGMLKRKTHPMDVGSYCISSRLKCLSKCYWKCPFGYHLRCHLTAIRNVTSNGAHIK